MAVIGQLMIDLLARTARLQADMDRNARTIDRASRRMQSSLRGVSRAAVAVGTALGGMFAAGSVIRNIANFEQAMANVQAISRATAEEMQVLNAAARRMGATTVFSAQEAAQGLGFLSMAGFSAQDAAEALPATLDLAAAGALNLGRAADIASNVISGFGLNASNAGRVADVLAAGASSANTSVEQLGEALSFAAPIAASYGISVETATAAIGALSNAGIQASRAGTGLNRVLNELAAPSTKTVELMERLGVALEDIDPTQNAFVDIIQRLDEAGAGAERFAGAMTEAFGERGAPAIQALLGQVDVLQQLDVAMAEANGRAREMAEIQSDTLVGAFRSFQSVVSEIQLQLGEGGLLDVMGEVITFATDIARVWAGMSDEVVNDLGTVQIAAEALKFALLALGGAAVLSALNALRLALLSNPLTLWVSVGAAAIGVLIDLFSSATSAAEEFAASSTTVAAAQLRIEETMRALEGATGRYADQLREALEVERQLEIAAVNRLISLVSNTQALVRNLRDLDVQSGLSFPSSPQAEAAVRNLQDLTEELRAIANQTRSVEVVEAIAAAIGHAGEMSVGSTRFMMEFGSGLREVEAAADDAAAAVNRASSAMIGFLRPRDFPESLPGLAFEDPMETIGRAFDGMAGLLPFAFDDVRGGGGSSLVSEQERLQEAYAETLAELDRQVFAQQLLAEAHGDTVEAVRAAEAHNRAYADAVRLGVHEDEAAVAAIEKRVIALQGLAQEIDLARMAEQGELNLAAAQDQFQLIGLSGAALEQAEARLRVIQDLRERGISLESTLAQQMIRTAEATAAARSEAELLSSAVGTAYEGLGQIASTAITNFEDLGRVAGQVLQRIAGMLIDFGTNQIFDAIFGSIVGGIGAFGGGGGKFAAGSGSIGVAKLHGGGLVGEAGLTHLVSPALFQGAPRFHNGLTDLRANEMPAILLDDEEVLTSRDPRHVRNLGSLTDVRPRGTGDNVVVQQTNHFARGMDQVARRNIMQMLPEIVEATTAAVIEARSRQPSIFEAPQ